MFDVFEDIVLDKNKKYFIEVVIDCIVVKEGIVSCFVDLFESVLKFGGGWVLIDVMGEEEFLFSEYYVCLYCGFLIGELELCMFLFNSLFGVCFFCDGFGLKLEVDLEFVIFNWDLLLNEYVIVFWELISL